MNSNRSSRLQPNLDGLVDALARQGWGVTDSLVDGEQSARLRRRLRYRLKSGSFRDAAVGRAATRARVRAVRGDRLCWLNDTAARGTERLWLDQLEQLRLALNQSLFLGLRHWEGHYAVYPPGAHYERHVDRFRDDDARVVSTVLYLNPSWRAEWGGQLRLYPEGQAVQDVEPAVGRFVCFMSANLPHEVLTTHHERLSIVGWFRRD
ncbi:SM-20-related protein [Natronospira proteinivora]|uniref:SM-20-related protein n=1 Tax=Natronospira proteinivora TaxID=1807133 RepID=A0ABT1G7T8_9GAMM|nr:2OG-Fe(II) oxygenase [Natronospira proteinivora]MCP1727364.1 SM-20-related protein [Natronospira proteinivora]